MYVPPQVLRGPCQHPGHGEFCVSPMETTLAVAQPGSHGRGRVFAMPPDGSRCEIELAGFPPWRTAFWRLRVTASMQGSAGSHQILSPLFPPLPPLAQDLKNSGWQDCYWDWSRRLHYIMRFPLSLSNLCLYQQNLWMCAPSNLWDAC